MPRKGSKGPYSVGRDVTRLLKGALLQHGMTQRQLSFHAGISESQVSRIFSFEKEMTIDQCEDLCVALDLSIADVFDLAVDERVWGREGEFTVDGFLVAEDPLDAMGRYELRRESAQRNDRARLEILQGGKNDDLKARREAGVEQRFKGANWRNAKKPGSHVADSSPREPGPGDDGYHDGP